MTKSRWSLLTTMLLAVAAVGCSEGARGLSPVGPSPVVQAAPAAVTAAATSWATANGWSAMADGRVAVADGVLIEGVEAIGEVRGGCPARTITLRGVAVDVSVVTAFTAPLSCSSLAPGQMVKVTGFLVQTAAGYVVTATHLAPVGHAPAPVAGGERLSGEGIVGAVSGRCPSASFVMLGYRVQATSATEYAGGSCESVREGTPIRLDVRQQADGSIVAERVEFLQGGRRD